MSARSGRHSSIHFLRVLQAARRRGGQALLAPLLAAAGRAVAGASVRWQGCEATTRQRIYFANHTSHLDFLVVWSALPAQVRRLTRPVAARDYWEGGLRRFLAVDVFNAVLIDRSPLHSTSDRPQTAIDEMLLALGDRYSLILFPEGTRGAGPEPAPFRSGLYNLVVQKPDLELVPVYLGNLHRVLPKGEFLPVPFMSSVTFGAPFRLETEEPRQAFLERARSALLSLRRS